MYIHGFLYERTAYSARYVMDGLVRKRTPQMIALHDNSHKIANLGFLVVGDFLDGNIRPFLPQSESWFTVEFLCVRASLLIPYLRLVYCWTAMKNEYFCSQAAIKGEAP